MALLMGCGSEFSDDEAEIQKTQFISDVEAEPYLSEAIQFWIDGLGFDPFDYDGRIVVMVVDYYPNGHDAHADWDGEGNCEIKIAANRLSRELLSHELGHCQGISEHSSDPNSIMFDKVNRFQSITPEIVEALQ